MKTQEEFKKYHPYPETPEDLFGPYMNVCKAILWIGKVMLYIYFNYRETITEQVDNKKIIKEKLTAIIFNIQDKLFSESYTMPFPSAYQQGINDSLNIIREHLEVNNNESK